MDRSDIIELIPATKAVDANGVERMVEGKARTVMCRVKGITRNEFFEAGRNGLNPEFQFDLFFGDYDGEKIVRYNGQRYAVYRTYFGRTDTVELYVERKGGTNGAKGRN
jgi:SPP1 family predicted phage head-tail adaptor